MSKVIATFQRPQDAEHVVHTLEQKGFNEKEVSMVTKHHQSMNSDNDSSGHNISSGTEWGAGIGAGAGLLASAGLLAVPGIGPLLAAGPLAAVLGGAAVGGLTGAFVDWGVPKAEGQHLQKQVEEGHAVVLVDSPKSHEAVKIFKENHAHEVKELH